MSWLLLFSLLDAKILSGWNSQLLLPLKAESMCAWSVHEVYLSRKVWFLGSFLCCYVYCDIEFVFILGWLVLLLRKYRGMSVRTVPSIYGKGNIGHRNTAQFVTSILSEHILFYCIWGKGMPSDSPFAVDLVTSLMILFWPIHIIQKKWYPSKRCREVVRTWWVNS